MRIFGAVLFGATMALTGPAVSQMPNINMMPELQSKTPEEKEAEAQREKAYKESLRKVPDAKGSADPWGGVRGTESAKSAGSAKPKAKSEVKSGSASN